MVPRAAKTFLLNFRNLLLLGYNKSFPGGGAKWIPAWQLHARDPTLVLWKACYNNLNGDLKRKGHMARYHPDDYQILYRSIIHVMLKYDEPDLNYFYNLIVVQDSL